MQFRVKTRITHMARAVSNNITQCSLRLQPRGPDHARPLRDFGFDVVGELLRRVAGGFVALLGKLLAHVKLIDDAHDRFVERRVVLRASARTEVGLLNQPRASPACNLNPRAFTTLRIVSKSGLRSPESAL